MATQKTSFWLTPKGLAALGLIGAATYFLLIEHRQHVWQFLPFLILLACPPEPIPTVHLLVEKSVKAASLHARKKTKIEADHLSRRPLSQSATKCILFKS